MRIQRQQKVFGFGIDEKADHGRDGKESSVHPSEAGRTDVIRCTSHKTFKVERGIIDDRWLHIRMAAGSCKVLNNKSRHSRGKRKPRQTQLEEKVIDKIVYLDKTKFRRLH